MLETLQYSPLAGFGNYLARPLFRERHRPDMSEAEATKLMHDALKVRARIQNIWTFEATKLMQGSLTAKFRKDGLGNGR